MNIFSKMDNLVSLTENEKILVSYIKENPEAFVKMTSAEISEASFISNATIYRLCKKLDLAGLSELKILVSASVGDYLKERNIRLRGRCRNSTNRRLCPRSTISIWSSCGRRLP